MKVTKEIKDVFYLIALQGVNYIAPLLVLPYLMVVLGTEKFGYIGFSLSVTQYFMLIVDFGFNLSATKKIALLKDDKESLSEIFSSTLFAKIILLVISFFLFIIISHVNRFEVYKETMSIMFIMVIANAFNFVWFFQGIGKIRVISIINSIVKLSILPLTFLFVKSSADFIIAASIQVLVYVFSSIICVGYLLYYRLTLLKIINISLIVKELKDSFPIFLSIAATTIYTASFVIVLGYFSTPEAVGEYSAVDRIMRALCYLVLLPTLQAFYPKVSQLGLNNIRAAFSLIKKILLFMIISMSLIFVVMFFLSGYAIDYLGDDYRNTSGLFKIMSFVPFFVGVGGVCAQLVILALGATAEKKYYQRVYLFAGLIALFSVFILVSNYNQMGAVISLLITESLVCILMVVKSKKLYRNNCR